MILSGKEIYKRLGNDIIIYPFNKEQLNPNSYNLKLHNELLIYKNRDLDMKKKNKLFSTKITEKGLRLRPGILYLGRTEEYTRTNNLVPVLSGRSSIGRLGVCIHITAAFGDIGFKGYWTLEITCVQPIWIYPNIEICQIYYHQILGEFEKYSGKYQDNKEIQGSMLYKDFKKGSNL